MLLPASKINTVEELPNPPYLFGSKEVIHALVSSVLASTEVLPIMFKLSPGSKSKFIRPTFKLILLR